MNDPRCDRHDVLFDEDRLAGGGPAAVSVAVSLHNYERFIAECLDSVAAQKLDRLDLIVVDDASDRDASAERCRSWMERHACRFERTLLLRHRGNRGLAEARNTAFAAARTDFVFVLDADNAIYPRALQRLLEAARDASADAAYSQLEFHGDQIGLSPSDVWSRERLRRGPYIDAMALISRSVWREVGGYSHIEGGWEDFDFWCKLAEHGTSALFVPEVLCRYRVHATSMLRTDTAAAQAQIQVEMTVRHPWLTWR